MCWHYKYATLGFLLLLKLVPAAAQNTTAPYSILGIGDIETRDFGRYFAGGNTSTARRDALAYNVMNPASLTALSYKTMNMDFAFRGKASNFTYPNSIEKSDANRDFVLKRISLAFKVTEKAAIAFGLRPFSTVNYQYSGSGAISDGNATIYKNTEGEGGINQVYASYAHSIGRRLNAGITANWLFGNSTRYNTYYSTEADLNVSGKFEQSWYGAGVNAGLQYNSAPEKKLQHFLGITAGAYQKLKGSLTQTYYDANGIIDTKVNDNRFKMPVTLSAGYTAALHKTYRLSVEAQVAKWPYQKLAYTNSYINDSYKLGVGFEYAPRIKNAEVEKFYLAAGFNYERNYMVINKKYLHDRSISMGAGYNASRQIYLQGGIEAGRRGSSAAGQYQENYLQFVLGFTLKDIWIGSKRFGRYY